MSLLSTAQAARHARVAAHRVRDWKRRRLLEPKAHDRRGWPLYDPADVLAVERRTRRDHRGHRIGS